MGTTEALLEGLTPSQRYAVTIDAAPLCVLAGAGSGKTRVLTRRIAWRILEGSAEPAHVLALTFTRKAAGELQRRLEQLGVHEQVASGTFHAVAYAQLRRLWADEGQAAPALLDRKVGLLAGLVRPRRTGGPGAMHAGGQGANLADVAAEIEWAKARLVRPDDYPSAAAAAGRRPPLPASEIAAVFASYEDEKRRRGLVDFDDLLVELATRIESDPTVAAAQRWRFSHLFVDELQDVNPAQARLLDAWLGERVDLCVVGDPNQAIYSWNGADPSVLTGFAQRHPGATVVRLEENWRSSPQVLAVATAVLTMGRRGAKTQIRSMCEDGPLPTVTAYATDRAEARGIARRLQEAGRQLRWSELAVLTRTNAQLVLMEEALSALRVPHRVRGGSGFLALDEVRAALAGLRRHNGPFASALLELSRSLADEHDEERRANLEALVSLAAEYRSVDPSPSAPGFSAWLGATLGADRPGAGKDAVELATFHRAKGLEWPVVFLAGLERGLVPIGQATTPAAEAEERRLLYVAMTRAERELHCSWAERRTVGERQMARSPSPYIQAIQDTLATLQGRGDSRERPGGDGGRRAVLRKRRQERPAVGLARAADPELLEALRAWRAAAARSSGVPAYVIFHDSTLAALAAARPASEEELLALPGLGPVKVARYGRQLIELVGDAAT